ncbi:MAG: dihydroorotase [Cytophagales bacterium]|nr:MAG: dihydroorotase [Cytophagales bacterium]TAF61735.1 MAG: dihydroorotase [Cytophagales bacterium]
MNLLIKNASVINEGQIKNLDVLIKNGLIEKIAPVIDNLPFNALEIKAEGLFMMPGVIDDQVHFREPGLTHKACIATEARAAVVGGTTSFMEMPNTVPNTLTQKLLQEKYDRAQQTSLANYSFFMGVSNDNIEEVLRTDKKTVCGLKIFMGSSTGNMLVDNEKVLTHIFSEADLLIATHCEQEARVRARFAEFEATYGAEIPVWAHPLIRDEEACLMSSRFAAELARKHNTRLHILHISTLDELALFSNALPLKDKRITAEVCVHHLWFSADDYARLGSQIKCNPAVKASKHKEELFKALLDNRLDIIATDHAPHTWAEKQNKAYKDVPSGVPLVQHSLYAMLDFYKQGKISLEKIAEKMCHAVADCFQIEKRGYIREGYFADLVLFDIKKNHTVSKENLHYHCAWSPFEGHTFGSEITHTIVSGHLAYANGVLNENQKGQRLTFSR